MRKWVWFIVALAMLIGLGGCACAPPRIERNRYIDAEAGYSFEMPPGWKIANHTPFFLEDDIKAIIDPTTCQILTNQSETTAILTVSFEYSFRWTQMNLDELTFVPTIESRQLEKEIFKAIRLRLKSEYRNLDIMPNGRRVTHRNWKANKDEFEIRAVGGFVVPAIPESGMTDSITWIYLYPCRGGRAHSLWLILMSNETDFSDNMKVLRTLESSLRGHDKWSF